jgi:predicted nucleic acid-binding protein
MADSVYLETSVISALFDEREDVVCQAQHKQMQAWHDQQAAHYDLLTSVFAVEELRRGTYDHQKEAVSFAERLKLLPVDDEILGVARIYTDRRVIPRSCEGDAVHLAAA